MSDNSAPLLHSCTCQRVRWVRCVQHSAPVQVQLRWSARADGRQETDITEADNLYGHSLQEVAARIASLTPHSVAFDCEIQHPDEINNADHRHAFMYDAFVTAYVSAIKFEKTVAMAMFREVFGGEVSEYGRACGTRGFIKCATLRCSYSPHDQPAPGFCVHTYANET